MKPTYTSILILLICAISLNTFGQSANVTTPVPKDRDIMEVTPTLGTLEEGTTSVFSVSAAPNPANNFTVVTIKGARGAVNVVLKSSDDETISTFSTGTVAGEDIILHIDLEKVETGVYIVEATSSGSVIRYPLAVYK